MSQTAESIFYQARAMPAGEREPFLRGACADDVGLRAKVDALLRAEEHAGSFLKTVAPVGEGGDDGASSRDNGATIETPGAEQPGQMIGRYKLLQPIGEGGFGSVWMAEQREPVKRRIALKIIKLGMDTKQVIARFEAERQALAMMDHPNIARVLDAGATETGRPYFVMEYIRGVPIIEYCDTERLDTAARLELFISVCHAIQHAHQKGVIHRDIKPSNVLVTLHDGVPVPKVIDFGIAKATSAELTTKTLFTQHRQMIGTPAYMSPEQAEMSGLDIDTRSDVYALGVLLYELLTGTTPFDATELMSKGFAEMMRIIREVEPPKPSTRLSSLGETATRTAQVRHVDPRKLGALLRGDLDWIVMRCLEKDRSRRYETANGLAADIRRHLDDQPVVAGPPTAAYRVRKFVRRNRGLVAASATLAAVLVVATIAMSLLTDWALRERFRAKNEASNARLAEIQEREERERAESALSAEEAARAEEARQRRAAERIVEFVTDTLTSSDPFKGGEHGFLVSDAMDEAIGLLEEGRLREEPATEVALRLTIAEILNGNARAGDGLQMAKRALEISRQIEPGDSQRTAACLDTMALCLKSTGQPLEALPNYEEALQMTQRLFPGDHPDVARSLNNLAVCLDTLGRSDEALPKHEAALEMTRRLFEGDHARVATGLNNEADCLESLGRSDEALSMYLAALHMTQRIFEGDHPDVARCLNNVAYCLQSLGRVDEALPKYEASLEMRQRLFDGDHPRVATGLNNVGYCLDALGREEKALPRYQAALEMRQRLFEGDHLAVATSLNNVAGCLNALDRTTDAIRYYESSLEMNRRLLPADHPRIAISLNNIATCYMKLDQYAEALPLLQESVTMAQRALPADHPSLQGLRRNQAKTLRGLGRRAEAEAILLDILDQLQSDQLRRRHYERTVDALVDLYEDWDNAEPGAGYADQAAAYRAKLKEQGD